MRQKTVLLILITLIASGCTSTENTETPEQKMQELVNQSQNTTYQVKYTATGPEAPENTEITVKGLEGGEVYTVDRETPGGTVSTKAYVLEEKTVVCGTDPSSESVSCTVGEGEVIQKMLQIEKWTLKNLTYTGEKNISGRVCKAFSASAEKAERKGLTSTETDLDFCLDFANGFPSGIEVIGDGTILNFTAENVETNTGGELELPKTLGVTPHCTDSYEIDLTPLKQVEEAEIELNSYSKIVRLPKRFETQSYNIPEQKIDEGENNITVRTEGEISHIICYRRP
ncbi:hypothetical protein AQV86_03160 [Nanohaloarchaea archaeon SG9]|nr:hypothetical protein AQV86_03160 [Nanohaloarchaea archaeon SG9]